MHSTNDGQVGRICMAHKPDRSAETLDLAIAQGGFVAVPKGVESSGGPSEDDSGGGGEKRKQAGAKVPGSFSSEPPRKKARLDATGSRHTAQKSKKGKKGSSSKTDAHAELRASLLMSGSRAEFVERLMQSVFVAPS
jgi:hypothetical protein